MAERPVRLLNKLVPGLRKRWPALPRRTHGAGRVAGSLTGDGGHVWLHSGCHGNWACQRRATAVVAFAGFGLKR